MSQTDKLYNLLKSGRAYRTDEIMEQVYGNDHLGLARIGARIYDLKKKYGVDIRGKKDDENPSLYWYWIVKPSVEFPLAREQKVETANLFEGLKVKLKK